MGLRKVWAYPNACHVKALALGAFARGYVSSFVGITPEDQRPASLLNGSPG